LKNTSPGIKREYSRHDAISLGFLVFTQTARVRFPASELLFLFSFKL
jgi:hypothetical protein